MSIDQDQRLAVAAVLDGLAPGPELDSLLEGLSAGALAGEDLAAYLRACARQQARAESRTLTAMHHLGRARAGSTERFSGVDEFSGDEVAAVLCWSRSMATRKLGLADDLEVRLPAVGEAVWEGRLDVARASRLCEWTRDVPDDLARHVGDVLLPVAAGMTVGELIDRIEQVVIELDPGWASRREARARRNGRLILQANPSGTATLSLVDVAATSGLAMRDRVDALAAAIRGLGVLTPIGTLRKEVAERLLDGSLTGLDDHRVALLLAAEYHAPGDDPGPDDPGPEGPSDGGPDDPDDPDGPSDGGPRGPSDGSPSDGGPGDPGDPGGPGDRGPGDRGPDDRGPDDDSSSTGGARGDDRGDHTGADPSGADPLGGAVGGADECTEPEQGLLDLPDLPGGTEPFPALLDGPEPGSGRVRAGVGEVRLRLTTALGLDDLPGQVPGYGTVLADHARTLLSRYLGGEWRVVCTDDQGRLQHVLLARRRPHPPRPGGSGQRCRAIVELHVPTTLLAALDPRDHGRWAALLAELQARLVELPREGGPPVATVADLYRRRPRIEIDRWTRVRDRCCVAPACRRRAQSSDLDHTLDHAFGGPSLDWNLGVLDRHHHRAKHHGGWTLHQPHPGHFRWRTRAGVHHTTRPKKILVEPAVPRPAARPRPLLDDGAAWTDDDHPDWRARYRRRTGLTEPEVTASAVHPDDDPPPF
ncbi:HNH endonuclease signature motif containing protein [Actinomycetospora chlora]|uniref:HNH endonuclease signature motif containing protein n=1 Tax=Actinomycetospora chlora TaxID=663608 RepID=UPI0031F0F25E